MASRGIIWRLLCIVTFTAVIYSVCNQLSPSHGNFKKLLREADKSRIKNQPRTVIVQRLILFNVIHANVYVGNI